MILRIEEKMPSLSKVNNLYDHTSEKNQENQRTTKYNKEAENAFPKG